MKKILLLLAEGFEEIEALTPVDYMRRKDIVVDTCSIEGGKKVTGAHNITVEADKVLGDIRSSDEYDGVIIPGGLPGATNLRDNDRVIDLVREFHESEKLIGAICAGPIVLQKAGILDGKQVTSYPGFEDELGESKYKEATVVKDGNIITARGPAVAVYFTLEIMQSLIGKEKTEELRGEILLDLVEDSIK